MSEADCPDMRKLLSAAYQNGAARSLNDLIQAVERLDNLQPAETHELKKLLALAHLLCFNTDRKNLNECLRLSAELNDWPMISELLRLARLYGLTDAVTAVRQIGLTHGLTEFAIPDFKTWFKEKGIKWFEYTVDEEEGVAFINPDDFRLIRHLVPTEFTGENFWPEIIKSLDDDSALSPIRKELLKKMAADQLPCADFTGYPRAEVDSEFRRYCERRGLQILKTLQLGQEEAKRCSYVYLILDDDGIVKVLKELLDYNHGRWGNIFDNEDRVYEHLPRVKFLPRYYGQATISPEARFIKQSVHFGQTIKSFTARKQLSVDEACYLVGQIAEQLAWLHEHDVLYLDLKPENILFNGSEIQLLDLGISRILKGGETEIDIIPAEPKYVTPEGALRQKATAASDIYQLGILFHELLAGSHPFCLAEASPDENDSREAELLNYLLPSLVLQYNGKLDEQLGDSRPAIIREMLSHNPSKRPSLGEIISVLGNKKPDTLPITQSKRSAVRPKENNTILFPARMGIPHRGHIEYIARLLEIGFHVTISLQRSYTLTDRDPLPKWLVAKMVAQSLFLKGFTEEDFDFIFTPLCRDRQEMAMHFALMPGRENIIGVASSNPEIHSLFADLRLFDQKSVFGFEDEEYRILSWGEILRTAVKENDRKTFADYAAGGIEKICGLDELRRIYGRPEIDFVSGPVKIVLLGRTGQELARTRGLRYLSPEESLAAHFTGQGKKTILLDRYEKISRLEADGAIINLSYSTATFNGGEETIFFNQT